MNRLLLSILPVMLGLPAFGWTQDLGAMGDMALVPKASAKSREDVMGGLIVNQTVSPQGHQFYRLFAQAMREKADSETRVFSVIEKPSRRFGSKILVMNGENKLFESALPFKDDKLAALSAQAVDAVVASVAAMLLETIVGPGSDLAASEI